MKQEKFAILQRSLSILQQCFVWPKTNNLLLFYFSAILSFVSYFPFLLGIYLHMAEMLKARSTVGLYKNISSVSGTFGFQYVTHSFFFKYKSLTLFFRKLSNFESFDKPDNFDKENARLNFFSKCVLYFIIFAVMGHVFSVLVIEMPKCNKINEELDIHEACMVLTPTTLPFKFDYFPISHIIFFYQIYALYMVLQPPTIVAYTVVEACHHICLRLRHLKRLLKEAFEAEDYYTRRQRLNYCIKYHVFIIDLYKNCDACYKNAMGINVGLGSVVIGSVCLENIQNFSVGSLLHLTGWIVSLFCLSFAGERMIQESISLADVAYCDCKWYESELDLQKDLYIMMIRAQRPFILHTAPFGYLSLPKFLAIVKTSYSIITLLNSTL